MTENSNTKHSLFDCNVDLPNFASRINWRASLVPAAAVIPAPIAYIKVVAVKKLVVVRVGKFEESSLVFRLPKSCFNRLCVTLRKFECSSRANCLHNVPWNNSVALILSFGLHYWGSWLKGIVGGIRTEQLEVKFLDLFKTNQCESICQGCFH